MTQIFEPQVRAWRGQASLAMTFWGHGVFVSGVMVLAYIHALYRHDEIMQQGLLSLFLLYTPWVLVAVWRCGEASTSLWGVIARFLTFAWAGNTLLVVGFLQLELLQKRGLLG